MRKGDSGMSAELPRRVPVTETAWLRWFDEIRERTGGDVDLLNLVNTRVEALRQTPGIGPVTTQARTARLAAISAQSSADSNTARIKELQFLNY